MGKRLGEYTRENTKCMVPVNGIRLIDRVLSQLEEVGIGKLTIVVGYKGQNLKDYIGSKNHKIAIDFIDNPVYDKTNNIYSLYLAADRLQQDDTLLLESDLIYDTAILRKILDDKSPNVALVAKYESWMDGTMVRIDENNDITNFIPKSDFNYSQADQYYKTVNIYKFSKEFSRNKYIPFLEAYTKAVGNNEYYENVLRLLTFMSNTELKALPLKGEKWYEIDDKQDLDIAEAIFADEDDVLKKYYGRYGGYWRFPKMLDYCYLVNPYFPSARMVDELQANFPTLLTQYPSGMKVNTLLASKCWGVSEEYIIPGNGAAELIKNLMERQKGKVGVIRPTFEEYPNRLPEEKIVTYTAKGPDFRYGVTELKEYFGARPVETLLLINPDNPSGNFIPQEDVKNLAQWCGERGTTLVVDESFVDFSENWEYNTLLSDAVLEQFPNLIVIKSISKSYGVPGLRLGILATADKALIASMKKEVSIWNLNSFAEYFMQIFSKYEKDYRTACDKFLAERESFYKGLRSVRFLRPMPSQANYFLCEILPPFKASELVIRLLKEHDILTRDCSSKTGFDGRQYMRIAVRNHSDNERLITALKSME